MCGSGFHNAQKTPKRNKLVAFKLDGDASYIFGVEMGLEPWEYSCTETLPMGTSSSSKG